jgi:transcription termination/antitermination protein NusG
MPFFAVQIWTGDEGRFLSIAGQRVHDADVRFYWPRRSLRIKRGGSWRESLAPIFPGYMFIQADSIDAELFGTLKGAPGFLRFLLSNENIVALERADQALLTHFLGFGEIVDKSLVYFDANKRIRVVSGPLKGLEGRIVRVDRRKGRAKVRLEMYENSFEIDFGFESLEAAPQAPAESHGEASESR